MDAHGHTICSLNLGRDTLSLIKSILILRPEPWQWTDAPELAPWWLVDVDEPVETRTVVRSLDRTVLALASSFSNLPAPHWIYLAKPLRSHMLLRVLDHHGGANGAGPSPDAEWHACRLRLLRRPDIPGFRATPAFLQWCAEMLKRPVPYVQLIAALPTAQVRELLADASNNGYLETTPCRDTTTTTVFPPAGTEPAPSTRWARLWSG